MSFKHFGNLGDIFKHIPLCEILAIEQPRRYIDTNSAYPFYDLADETEEQRYGVYHVARHINQSNLLSSSHWWQALKTSNKHEFEKYMGSPGLALHVLGNRA